MQIREPLYEVSELEPGFFRIGNSQVFMDLIVGTHHALLFDTGYGFGDLYGLVRSITDRPLYVVNSHGHVDHTCGNWQFPQVCIHPKDMDLCREHNGPELRSSELDAAEVPADFDLDEYLHHDCGALIPVGEGDCFDLGGIRLEVVELPGHTRGSIGLFCRDKGLLYVGDAMNCFVWLFLPEAEPLSVYINTLQKAAALPFSRMIQSHEPLPVPKRRLWDYLDLAEHLDFETGELVSTPGYGGEARICTRNHIHYDDREHPGFAAILISREKI